MTPLESTRQFAEGFTGRARAVIADGDRGAQAAEYAMVGGVGAAVCGGVAVYINNDNQGVVGGVIETLIDAASGWIGTLF